MGQTLAKRQQEKFRKDNKIIGFLGDEYPIESYFTKLSITTSKGKWNPAETETITVPTNDTTKYDGNLMSGKQDPHSSGFAVYTLKAEKEITTSVLEEIESLCNNSNNNSSSNKILLIGEPGIGKSTLVRFICYQWSMGRLWNQKFNHIWFIELKELVDWLLDASNDGFLMNDLKENKKLIIRPFHSKAEKYANFIYYIKKKKSNGIIPNIRKEEIAKRILLKKELFLFDGYDEISVNLIKLQNEMSIMIDPWKEAKELIDTFSNYIVTSRPNAIYEQKIQEKIPFDKTLKNLGFSQEGRLEYVRRYFSTKPITPELREQLVTTILQFIEEVEMIKEICRIPLNVEIICYLWYDDYYRNKLNQQEFNLTILYSLMEMKLAEWYKYKNEGNKIVTAELKEFLQRLSFLSLFRNQIRGVNEATIQELLTEKFVGDGKSNDNRNHHQLEEFMKDVGNLGFIHPVYPSWPTRKQDHYFNHKTFQEYFSAQFIIELLTSPVPNISQTLQNFDLRNFIIENCFNPYYLQTFKFVCGLLSVHQEVYSTEEENRNKMQEFLRIIVEATLKQDATGRKQFVLLLHLFSQISSSFMKSHANSVSIYQLCLNHITKYLVSHPVQLSSIVLETGFRLPSIIDVTLPMLSKPQVDDSAKISILRLMRNVHRGYPQYPQILESLITFISLSNEEENPVNELLSIPEIVDEALCTLAIISYKDMNVVEKVMDFMGCTYYHNVISALSYLRSVLPSDEFICQFKFCQLSCSLALSFCLTAIDVIPVQNIYEMLGAVNYVDDNLRDLINVFINRTSDYRNSYVPKIIQALTKSPPDEAVKLVTTCSLINLTSEEKIALCDTLLKYPVKLRASVHCLGSIGQSIAIINALLSIADKHGLEGREIAIIICKTLMRNPSICTTQFLRWFLEEKTIYCGIIFFFVLDKAPIYSNLVIELVAKRIAKDLSEYHYWANYLQGLYDLRRDEEGREEVNVFARNFYFQLLTELASKKMLTNICVFSTRLLLLLQENMFDIDSHRWTLISEIITEIITTAFENRKAPRPALTLSYEVDQNLTDHKSGMVLREVRIMFSAAYSDQTMELQSFLEIWPVILKAVEFLSDRPQKLFRIENHEKNLINSRKEATALQMNSHVEFNLFVPLRVFLEIDDDDSEYSLILLEEFLKLCTSKDIKNLEEIWRFYRDISEKKEPSFDIVSSLFLEDSSPRRVLLTILFIKFEALFDLPLANKLIELLNLHECDKGLFLTAYALYLHRFPEQINGENGSFAGKMLMKVRNDRGRIQIFYLLLLNKPPHIISGSESIINDPSFNRALIIHMCHVLQSCESKDVLEVVSKIILFLMVAIMMECRDFCEECINLPDLFVIFVVFRYSSTMREVLLKFSSVKQYITCSILNFFNCRCEQIEFEECDIMSEIEQRFLDDIAVVTNSSSKIISTESEVANENLELASMVRLIIAASVKPMMFTVEILEELLVCVDDSSEDVLSFIIIVLYLRNKSIRDYDSGKGCKVLARIASKFGLYFFTSEVVESLNKEALLAIMFHFGGPDSVLPIVNHLSLKFLLKMKGLFPIEFQEFASEQFIRAGLFSSRGLRVDYQLLFDLFPSQALKWFEEVHDSRDLSKEKKENILSIFSANISNRKCFLEESDYLHLMTLSWKNNYAQFYLKLLSNLKDSLPVKQYNLHRTRIEPNLLKKRKKKNRILTRFAELYLSGTNEADKEQTNQKIKTSFRHKSSLPNQSQFYMDILDSYEDNYERMTETHRKELLSFLFSLLSMRECFSDASFREYIELLSLPKQLILEQEIRPRIRLEMEIHLIEKILPQLINDLSSRFEVIQRRAINLIYYTHYHEDLLVVAINESKILNLERIQKIELLFPLMEERIHYQPEQERRRLNLIKDTLAKKKRLLLEEEKNFQIELLLLPPSDAIRSQPLVKQDSSIIVNTNELLLYDVFLSHDWGLNNRNHSWVSKVNEKLKEKGLKTWFDGEQMKGDIRAAMVRGIEHSKVMLVFITENYSNKVNTDDNRDNCRYEFKYGFKKIGPNKMVPIVMESKMKDTRNWQGELGAGLGDHLYQDLSGLVAQFDENLWSQSMDQIYERIISLLC